jgi:uncharacterized protein (TIGR02271 family)
MNDDKSLNNVPHNAKNEIKLFLKEEQLNISKTKIETGKVKVHREIITEDKVITVPVNREVLVIEKTVFDSKNHGQKEGITETIKIPLSEECIEVKKRKIKLENVSICKHQFEKVKRVEETLKKEKLHIKTKGDAEAKVIRNREFTI